MCLDLCNGSFLCLMLREGAAKRSGPDEYEHLAKEERRRRSGSSPRLGGKNGEGTVVVRDR